MRAVLFANGIISDYKTARERLHPDDLLIAADGGARHCDALGVQPAVLIGDLDSVTAEEVTKLEAAGVEIIRHNQDKDETDLELALLYARRQGAKNALVLGGLGGRWDQTLANLLLPLHTDLAGFLVHFWEAGETLFLIQAESHFNASPGDTVSLIPLKGDAIGVTTHGLQWPLDDEILRFGATRGVSNRATATEVSVQVADGVLLCVHTKK